MLLEGGGEVTVWSFYLFGDLFNTLMLASFFAFLNDSVAPGDTKRLYGPIVLGGVAGGAFGSLFVAAQIDNLASQLGWPAGGLPGVLIGGELVLGIQVHSTASPSDLDDPLRVLAEWLWRREMALDFVHSAPSNAILLGPMP